LDEAPDRQETHRKLEHAIRLTEQENYADALPIFEANLSKLSSKDMTERKTLADSSSYYGLCLALGRREYADAIDYCKVPLKTTFANPDHHANLALVYLRRDDREKAVRILHAGLRMQPNHVRTNQILNAIGKRQKPVLPFLSRDNPLNIWLGRRRSEKQLLDG